MVSGSLAYKANASGNEVSNSPTTRSNCPCAVPSAPISMMSPFEMVTDPPPSSARALMLSSTAMDQFALGTPIPTVHLPSPSMPAALADARITPFASSVSAEQTSKCAPVSSIKKRKVNGVMTGRGAEMSKRMRRPGGAARFKRFSSAALSSALSVMAVIDTRPAEIETFDRGSCSIAVKAKPSASFQPSGVG